MNKLLSSLLTVVFCLQVIPLSSYGANRSDDQSTLKAIEFASEAFDLETKGMSRSRKANRIERKMYQNFHKIEKKISKQINLLSEHEVRTYIDKLDLALSENLEENKVSIQNEMLAEINRTIPEYSKKIAKEGGILKFHFKNKKRMKELKKKGFLFDSEHFLRDASLVLMGSFFVILVASVFITVSSAITVPVFSLGLIVTAVGCLRMNE